MEVVRRGFGGVRLVALGAVAQKVVSVVLNQVTLKLPYEVVGVARTRLELVLSGVLVLREGFRIAVIRSPEDVGLAWVPAVGGVGVACLLGYFGGPVVRLYCVAAGLEALSEPAHALSVARAVAGPRVLAESCGTLCSGVTLAGLPASLEACGWAQIAYSTGLGLGRLCGWPDWRALLPRQPPKWERARNAFVLSAQAVLKQALTDADKLLLLGSSPRAAGVYAISQNYGSLVARALLQPSEDAVRGVLGRLDVDHQRRVAGLALRAGAVLGGGFAALGPPFAAIAPGVARRVFFGKPPKPEDAQLGLALAAFCASVPSLAVNGISEAVVHATGDDEALTGLVGAHARSAIAIAVVGAPALRCAGDDAAPAVLVLVTAAGMALRARFVLRLCRATATSSLLPGRPLLLAFGLVAALCHASRARLPPTLDLPAVAAHLALGVACAVFLLAVAWRSERPLLQTLLLRR